VAYYKVSEIQRSDKGFSFDLLNAENVVRCQLTGSSRRRRGQRTHAGRRPFRRLNRRRPLPVRIGFSDQLGEFCYGIALSASVIRRSPGRPLEPEKPRPKVLSFEPGKTTLTLTELFEENERRYKRSSYQRI
jgi:hypothetical protein